jgi:hypothetical protein
MGCLYDNGPDFGTRLDAGDDGAQEVTLLFNFPFYGTNYTNIWVNANGNLTLGFPDGTFSPTISYFKSSSLPRISPYWIDLDQRCFPSPDGVYAKSLPDRLIVTYFNVPYYYCGNHPPINTFQVVLFNTGLIRFAYSTLDNTLPAGDASLTFPLVGVASGSNGPSSIFKYDPPANTDPDQTVTGPTGFLDQNNQFLDWVYNGTNYDLVLTPCFGLVRGIPFFEE